MRRDYDLVKDLHLLDDDQARTMSSPLEKQPWTDPVNPFIDHEMVYLLIDF